MLILRIKQAEMALADGRLDEALKLAEEHRLHTHARGQRLATRLLAALVERGRAHLEAGRLTAALADAEKAGRIDRGNADLAALRQAVADATIARQQARRQRGDAIETARRCVNEGWLSGGAVAMRGLDDCVERVGVEQAISMEQARLQSTLERAEAAMEAGDYLAAADLLASVGKRRLADTKVTALATQVTEQALAAARSNIEAGRLIAARAVLTAIATFAEHRPEARELTAALGDMALAAKQFNAGHPARAARTLRRLARQWPTADWLPEAADAATAAADAADTFAAGPLGGLADQPDPPRPEFPVRHDDEAPLPPRGGARPASPLSQRPSPGPMVEPIGVMPERSLLQIDGVGTFVLLRSPSVQVGPISGASPVDLALIADATTPPIRIRRADDDYFLTSEKPVHVNDRPAEQALLSNGDRIALSRNCRLRFSLPHPASGTGVLDLTTGRLPRADVRRCLLVHREIVIGPSAAAHIHAPDLAEPIVLNVDADQLWIARSPGAGPEHARRPVPLDEAVAVGPLHLRLQRF